MVMPSAIASDSLMSFSRSTRTLTISSVIRLAHLGMWIDGRQRRSLARLSMLKFASRDRISQTSTIRSDQSSLTSGQVVALSAANLMHGSGANVAG
jgi:hypothetical protein